MRKNSLWSCSKNTDYQAPSNVLAQQASGRASQWFWCTAMCGSSWTGWRVKSQCWRLEVWSWYYHPTPWESVCSLVSWEWEILDFIHPLRQCMRADCVMGVNTHGENALQIKVYFYSSPQAWPREHLKCVSIQCLISIKFLSKRVKMPWPFLIRGRG